MPHEMVVNDTILVLGLGNDIMGDDSVGLRCARAVREYPFTGVQVVESAEAGLALLDYLEGHRSALILDAIVDQRKKPGTVVQLRPQDFRGKLGGSPHFMGLPDMLEMAEKLSIPVPSDIVILAMVVDNPTFLDESLSPEIAGSLPEYVSRALGIIQGWRGEPEKCPSLARKETDTIPDLQSS
jgi:hydrogenase maturation protease